MNELYTREQALGWLEDMHRDLVVDRQHPGTLERLARDLWEVGESEPEDLSYEKEQLWGIRNALVDCDLAAFKAFAFQCKTQSIGEIYRFWNLGRSLVYMCWMGLAEIPGKDTPEKARYMEIADYPLDTWEALCMTWDDKNPDSDENENAILEHVADRLLAEGALTKGKLPQDCAYLREDLANIQTNPLDIPLLPESMIGDPLPRPTEQPYSDILQEMCIDLEVLKGRLNDDWKAGRALLWEGRNDKGKSDRARSILEKVVACKSTLEAALIEAKS